MKRVQCRSGFTLPEIMIVVAIIGLLAAMTVPRFIKAREETNSTMVAQHLTVIDSAKDQCALMYGYEEGDLPPEADLVLFIRGGSVPDPPDAGKGGTYLVNPIGIYPQYIAA